MALTFYCQSDSNITFGLRIGINNWIILFLIWRFWSAFKTKASWIRDKLYYPERGHVFKHRTFAVKIRTKQNFWDNLGYKELILSSDNTKNCATDRTRVPRCSKGGFGRTWWRCEVRHCRAAAVLDNPATDSIKIQLIPMNLSIGQIG